MCSVGVQQQNNLRRPGIFNVQTMMASNNVEKFRLPEVFKYAKNTGISNQQRKAQFTTVPAVDAASILASSKENNVVKNVVLPDSPASYVGLPEDAMNTFCNQPNFMNDPVDSMKTSNVQYVVQPDSPALIFDPGDERVNSQQKCKTYCDYVAGIDGTATYANSQGDVVVNNRAKWTNEAKFEAWPPGDQRGPRCRCEPKNTATNVIPPSGIEVSMCAPYAFNAETKDCDGVEYVKVINLPPPGETMQTIQEKTAQMIRDPIVGNDLRATKMPANRTPYGPYGNLACLPWSQPQVVSDGYLEYHPDDDTYDDFKFALHGKFTRCQPISTSTCGADASPPRGYPSFREPGKCECFPGNKPTSDGKGCTAIEVDNTISTAINECKVTDNLQDGVLNMCFKTLSKHVMKDDKLDKNNVMNNDSWYGNRTSFVSAPCVSSRQCSNMYRDRKWVCASAESVAQNRMYTSPSTVPIGEQRIIYAEGMGQFSQYRYWHSDNSQAIFFEPEASPVGTPSDRKVMANLPVQLSEEVTTTTDAISSNQQQSRGYCLPDSFTTSVTNTVKLPDTGRSSDIVHGVRYQVRPEALVQSSVNDVIDGSAYQCGFTSRSQATVDQLKNNWEVAKDLYVGKYPNATLDNISAFGVNDQYQTMDALYHTPDNASGPPVFFTEVQVNSPPAGSLSTSKSRRTYTASGAKRRRPIKEAVSKSFDLIFKSQEDAALAASDAAFGEICRMYPMLLESKHEKEWTVVRQSLNTIANRAMNIFMRYPTTVRQLRKRNNFPYLGMKQTYLTAWCITPNLVASIESSVNNVSRQNRLRGFVGQLFEAQRTQTAALNRATLDTPSKVRRIYEIPKFKPRSIQVSRSTVSHSFGISSPSNVRIDHVTGGYQVSNNGSNGDSTLRRFAIRITKKTFVGDTSGKYCINIHPVLCSTNLNIDALVMFDKSPVRICADTASAVSKTVAVDDDSIEFEISIPSLCVRTYGLISPEQTDSSTRVGKYLPATCRTDFISGLIVQVLINGAPVHVEPREMEIYCLSTRSRYLAYCYLHEIPMQCDTHNALLKQQVKNIMCAQVAHGEPLDANMFMFNLISVPDRSSMQNAPDNTAIPVPILARSTALSNGQKRQNEILNNVLNTGSTSQNGLVRSSQNGSSSNEDRVKIDQVTAFIKGLATPTQMNKDITTEPAAGSINVEQDNVADGVFEQQVAINKEYNTCNQAYALPSTIGSNWSIAAAHSAPEQIINAVSDQTTGIQKAVGDVVNQIINTTDDDEGPPYNNVVAGGTNSTDNDGLRMFTQMLQASLGSNATNGSAQPAGSQSLENKDIQPADVIKYLATPKQVRVAAGALGLSWRAVSGSLRGTGNYSTDVTFGILAGARTNTTAKTSLEKLCNLDVTPYTQDDIISSYQLRNHVCKNQCDSSTEEHVTREKCEANVFDKDQGLSYQQMYYKTCNTISSMSGNVCPSASASVCVSVFPSVQDRTEQLAQMQRNAIQANRNQCNAPPKVYGSGPEKDKTDPPFPNFDFDEDEMSDTDEAGEELIEFSGLLVAEPETSMLSDALILESQRFSNDPVTMSPGLVPGPSTGTSVPSAGTGVALQNIYPAGRSPSGINNTVNLSSNTVFMAPPAQGNCTDGGQIFWQRTVYDSPTVALTTTERACRENTPTNNPPADALGCNPNNVDIVPYLQECVHTNDDQNRPNYKAVWQCRPNKLNSTCGVGTLAQVRGSIYMNAPFNRTTGQCDCSQLNPLYKTEGYGLGSRCVLQPEYLCASQKLTSASNLTARPLETDTARSRTLALQQIVKYHSINNTGLTAVSLVSQEPATDEVRGSWFESGEPCKVNETDTVERGCVKLPCVGIVSHDTGSSENIFKSHPYKCLQKMALPTAIEDTTQSSTSIPSNLCALYGNVRNKVMKVEGAQPGWIFLSAKDGEMLGVGTVPMSEWAKRETKHESVCIPSNMQAPKAKDGTANCNDRGK